MKTLSIDTSSNICSLAILDDSKIIYEDYIADKLTHSENLMPMIKKAFDNLQINLADIDLFACSKGPGSFTGIRIGVGIAKGLAYSLGKPIIGVNTLDIIANLSTVIDKDVKVISMIDARKERVYYGVYNKLQDNLELEKDYCDGEIREILTEYKNNKVLFFIYNKY